MTDTLVTEAPIHTTTSLSANPMDQVERAQAALEKGPITAVASFFVIAFFIALYFLLRAKDKHQASQSKLQADQAQEIAKLTEKHSEEMVALYTDERDRAIKHEVTMSNYLDMMDDVRFIAFEMRRVKLARERRRKEPEPDDNDGNEDPEGDSNG